MAFRVALSRNTVLKSCRMYLIVKKAEIAKRFAFGLAVRIQARGRHCQRPARREGQPRQYGAASVRLGVSVFLTEGVCARQAADFML
jgi:hypothetical protein